MAEDRNALLEKIRADMAASRQKIQEMKDKKARASPSDSTTVTAAAATEQSTGSQPDADSVVEKLRAQRAATRNRQPSISAEQTPSSPNTKRVNMGGRDRSASRAFAGSPTPTRDRSASRTTMAGGRKPSISGAPPKKVVVVRKKADGTEERIVQEIADGDELRDANGNLLRARKSEGSPEPSGRYLSSSPPTLVPL